MILYLAGGFHFSNKVESETELAEHLISKYGRYNRLGTFYYKKDSDNIMETKRRVDGNCKTATCTKDGSSSSREEDGDIPV